MRTGKPKARASRRAADWSRARRDVDLTVQYATRSRVVPSSRDFQRWIRAAIRAQARITVRLVGLAEGRTLNREYRARDYATNVLTFVFESGPTYAGDLVLCAPVVSREARKQRKHLIAHYAHLTVHGVLHLQGYEHEHEPEATVMEQRETRILKRLGFADPYALPTDHG